jgi:hypothetical protein
VTFPGNIGLTPQASKDVTASSHLWLGLRAFILVIFPDVFAFYCVLILGFGFFLFSV